MVEKKQSGGEEEGGRGRDVQLVPVGMMVAQHLHLFATAAACPNTRICTSRMRRWGEEDGGGGIAGARGDSAAVICIAVVVVVAGDDAGEEEVSPSTDAAPGGAIVAASKALVKGAKSRANKIDRSCLQSSGAGPAWWWEVRRML